MQDIEAFLAIIEAGGQTAAARRLGRSLQSVNRSLVALERSIGVELVRRTTRQSVATKAGLAFYRRVKPALAEISEARLEAANRRAEPSGLLRMAAPVSCRQSPTLSCATPRLKPISRFPTARSMSSAMGSISLCGSGNCRIRH
jgi:DNA-binding transcriptional LysR family regulator